MHNRWNLTLAFVLCVAVAFLAGAPAKAQPSDRPFNQLTSLAVSKDDRMIELFGIYNPLGPQEAIPYRRLFSDAFSLPDENLGNPTFPGFSLGYPPAERQAIAAKMANVDDSEFDQYLVQNPEENRRYLQAVFSQAPNEVRSAIRSLLEEHGVDERQVSEILSAIKTVDDLKSFARWAQANGVAGPYLLLQRLYAAADQFKNKRGDIFFYPNGLFPRMIGIPSHSEPHFYGINSNTQLARIVLQADIALKRVTADNSLKESLSFHQTTLEWKFRNLPPSEIRHDGFMVANIRPNRIQLSSSADGRVITFDQTDLGILYAPKEGQPSSANLAYSAFLTRHFDDYAHEIEPLWAMRELYKVLAAVRYLKSRGIAISAEPDNSWEPPRYVEPVWEVASLGLGGKSLGRLALTGGVLLGVQAATKIAPIPSQRAEAIRSASALTELEAVNGSGGKGVCYDGQPGCTPGVPIGAVKIGNAPRGTASLSPAVLAEMRKNPALSKLLDNEQQAIDAWSKDEDAVREIQAQVASAKDQTEKGRLEVELTNRIQKASTDEDMVNYRKTKVEEGAMTVSHQ